MLAENPLLDFNSGSNVLMFHHLYVFMSSDLNSIIILFVVLDIIFLFQLLKIDSDLGPSSEPVKYASKLRFPVEPISFIDM